MEAARALVGEALVLARDQGSVRTVAYGLLSLGKLAQQERDRGRALALYREALALVAGLGDPLVVVRCFDRIASIGGDPGIVAQLLGAAESLQERSGDRRDPEDVPLIESAASDARSRLGNDAFVVAFAAGRELTSEAAIGEMLVAGFAEPPRDGLALHAGDAAVGSLTRREREVLALLAESRSDREIAESLFISPKTAGVRVGNVLAKLGVPSRAATVAYVHKRGAH